MEKDGPFGIIPKLKAGEEYRAEQRLLGAPLPQFFLFLPGVHRHGRIPLKRIYAGLVVSREIRSI